MSFDKKFVEEHLLSKNGSLNARALEKYNISKDYAYQVYHGFDGPPSCKECGSATTFVSFNKGYTIFCSRVCVSKNADIIEKKRNTLEANFGQDGFKAEEILNKKKATTLEKYGVEHRRQDPLYVEMLKQEHLVKYGTSSPATTDAANKKRIATNIERYGNPNPVSNESVYEKIKNTNIKKYGVNTALALPDNRKKALYTRRDPDVYDKLNNPEWLLNNKDIPSTKLSEDLGIAFSTILQYYKYYDIPRQSISVSTYELQLAEFLSDHQIRYETGNRTILNGKEVDIFLIDFNIGIEIDGLYWHSDKFKDDRFYHIKKTELAAKKNIQLIHITDSEILTHRDIVYRRLLAKLGKSQKLYARKCSIVNIDNTTYTEFMTNNHIQGPAAASIRIGLEIDNQVVAIMAFSKPRYNKNYEWELIRYASVGNVVGGASRLFRHFIKVISPTSIISYSDRRWNTGNMYTAIGMEYSHASPPNYWYIVDGKLEHRSGYQKHKLRNKLSLYDETISERENMKTNGYMRYWDCGNNVYVWKR